ncbi:hypothetical protein GEMRC1_012183 [Eukaryota sp. GEM-RC1]
MSFAQRVTAKALDLIQTCIEITHEAAAGHPSSSASLAHLMTVLCYKHMKWDPQTPDSPLSDRIVLSEGHAAPIVYAIGADLGISIQDYTTKATRPMTRSDADTLRSLNSPIEGHPNPAFGFKFFPAATGSLGQGLSVALGYAAASKLDNIHRSVFCIIGDGESREGQISEALDFLVDHKLFSVCPIFNCNGWGQASLVSPQQSPERLVKKLNAYGFEVAQIDGHNADEILHAFKQHDESVKKEVPFAIVAKTTKMWGCPSLYTKNLHGKVVPDVQAALTELNSFRKQLKVEGLSLNMDCEKPQGQVPQRSPQKPLPNTFQELMQQAGKDVPDQIATRKVYGYALKVFGLSDDDVIACDGDVKNSTNVQEFADDPVLGKRYFEGKIAEQNMISFGAGAALQGKIPFISSFGHFFSRTYDQISLAVYSEANLKIVGSHVGLGPASDGPSQMALTDIAWSTSLGLMKRHSDGNPALLTINPCDGPSTWKLLCQAKEWNGPCYIRVLRQDTPMIYPHDCDIELTRGFNVVSSGKTNAILASGLMVHAALRVAAKMSVQPTVIDVYAFPYCENSLFETLNVLGVGKILTLEDNCGSSLGALVSSTVCDKCPGIGVRQLYVRKAPKSGRSVQDLLQFEDLDDDTIHSVALEFLR